MTPARDKGCEVRTRTLSIAVTRAGRRVLALCSCGARAQFRAPAPEPGAEPPLVDALVRQYAEPLNWLHAHVYTEHPAHFADCLDAVCEELVARGQLGVGRGALVVPLQEARASDQIPAAEYVPGGAVPDDESFHALMTSMGAGR